MTDWQITTTTIYCEAVDDEVTLLVYADGTVKCTGYTEYGNPNRETEKLLRKKSKGFKRPLGCEGMPCSKATAYRDKLFSEDKK